MWCSLLYYLEEQELAKQLGSCLKGEVGPSRASNGENEALLEGFAKKSLCPLEVALQC